MASDYPGVRNPVSEATQQRIDAAVHHIVMDNFEKAWAVLNANRDMLERSARALLLHETLDAAALGESTLGLHPVVQPPAEAPT